MTCSLHISGKPAFFLKGKREGMDLREEGRQWATGTIEGRKNCSQNVMCERRIKHNWIK